MIDNRSSCKLATFSKIAVLLTLFALCAPAVGKGPASGPVLKGADLLTLAKSLAKFSDDLPPAASLGMEKITAYEEHQYFTYIGGKIPTGERRVVFCKPSTFIIDDHARPGDTWRLIGSGQAKVAERSFSIPAGDNAAHGMSLQQSTGLKGGSIKIDGESRHTVDVIHTAARVSGRFLHLIHVGDIVPKPKVTPNHKDDSVTVEFTAAKRIFKLHLPEYKESGRIGVSQADGKKLLASRLLPAGIMPHGSKGVKLLDRWDSSYRRTRLPGWDVGRPAGELKRLVESGAVKPGRALVLGCGTGTNAVYLASKGFKVVGVDVAPSALTFAEKQAAKAKVKVQWMVADAVAVPDIGPFDFIFDRGCYHHVQKYNAAGFANTVSRLTGDGALFLLLAGNANESRHYGPPRVKQTKIVADFSETFAIQAMREIRFEGRDPERKNGPLAWSVLLRRRADKKPPIRD
ncbi:MAG: methyltransferase domain-containing protein [Phycisphaerae bacterium]|jgi:SAM-dependent methyltransferase|nr:methyltransferase domain-containing protein [Phycisphaerae bacterium]